jgi:hypothetical protein
MSVTMRPYRRGGWEVDIRVPLARGGEYRERKRLTVTSKPAARCWGEDRERVLLIDGPPRPNKEAPPLEAFAPRFADGHARANQHKPSGILHNLVAVVPDSAARRQAAHAITTEDVQQLKRRLSNQAWRWRTASVEVPDCGLELARWRWRRYHSRHTRAIAGRNDKRSTIFDEAHRRTRSARRRASARASAGSPPHDASRRGPGAGAGDGGVPGRSVAICRGEGPGHLCPADSE